MDRLSKILAFTRTAEHGSFAKAGATLGMHGSAVSKNVARLEEHLGLRLFNRTTRSLSLTAEGELLFERCVRILSDLDEAEAAMSTRSTALIGRLTVSLPVALGRLHIMPTLVNLFRDHPRVELSAHLTDRFVDLVSEGFDAAVRIGDPHDSALIGRHLASVRSVVCASDAYLAEMGRPARPEDLDRHRCITFAPASGARPLLWRFAEPGSGNPRMLQVSGPLIVNNAELLVDAAVSGAGLVQLHDYLAAAEIGSGRLRRVLDEHEVDGPAIQLLYPQARQITPKLRRFIEHVIELFRPQAPWRGDPSTLAMSSDGNVPLRPGRP